MDKRSGVFFNAFADTFDSLYESRRGPLMRAIDNYFRSDIHIRFSKTFEAFGDLHNKSILDIGCGSGVYLRHALDNGAIKVTGLDPAPRMLEISQQRLKNDLIDGNCELIEAAFPEYTCGNRYDHIIIMGVMDYIDDPVSFLSAIKPLLKGSASISFPSYHWFRSPIRRIRYRLRDCPVYFYDEDGISSLLIKSRFRNYEIFKIPGAGMDYLVTLYP